MRVSCDGCAADLAAKIYFISTTAEYTPPVIYSLEERVKLVYLIQARPDKPDMLRVGQPITCYADPEGDRVGSAEAERSMPDAVHLQSRRPGAGRHRDRRVGA